MGRKAEELKKFIKNVANKEVEGRTLGEILELANLQYTVVNLAVSVVDEEGKDIDSPTIVLKKGKTIGSGDAMSSEADGTYNVAYGDYNISVSKTGYTTKTAVVTVDYDDCRKEEKELIVVLAETAG